MAPNPTPYSGALVQPRATLELAMAAGATGCASRCSVVQEKLLRLGRNLPGLPGCIWSHQTSADSRSVLHCCARPLPVEAACRDNTFLVFFSFLARPGSEGSARRFIISAVSAPRRDLRGALAIMDASAPSFVAYQLHRLAHVLRKETVSLSWLTHLLHSFNWRQASAALCIHFLCVHQLASARTVATQW